MSLWQSTVGVRVGTRGDRERETGWVRGNVPPVVEQTFVSSWSSLTTGETRDMVPTVQDGTDTRGDGPEFPYRGLPSHVGAGVRGRGFRITDQGSVGVVWSSPPLSVEVRTLGPRTRNRSTKGRGTGHQSIHQNPLSRVLCQSDHPHLPGVKMGLWTQPTLPLGPRDYPLSVFRTEV